MQGYCWERGDVLGVFSFSSDYVLSKEQVIKKGVLSFENNAICGLNKRIPEGSEHFAFEDVVMYPGLFNAHDHLLGTYHPKVGKGSYLNWQPWDNDLKSDVLYHERNKNGNEEIYLLGSYRNLFSGCLTVSDHIPHAVNQGMISKMPIRILEKYALAHEISSFELPWGGGWDVEYEKAKKNNEPFITHIEEGFDPESMKGIEYLAEKKILGSQVVFVHALGLSDHDMEVISRSGAHMVWCPNSNFFMFGCTARIRDILRHGIPVSLGTDSSMSGSVNMFEEMRFAKDIWEDMYGTKLADKDLFHMVTDNPARAFRVDSMLGSLEQGKNAEFILLERKFEDPYLNLVQASSENLDLIFFRGFPIFGKLKYEEIFKVFQVRYHKFQMNGEPKLIANEKPTALLKKIRDNVGKKEKTFPFFPIDID